MTEDDDADEDLVSRVSKRRLNGRLPLQCNVCGTDVGDGETVVARFHRDDAAGEWLITGRFCQECAPETAPDPGAFDASALVRGHVGTAPDPRARDRFAVLLDPTVADRR